MTDAFVCQCTAAAQNIRGGGLIGERDVSQVKPQSFMPLARINEAGFLTVDSQDGQVGERSYVAGFMPTSRAHVFVDTFNTSTNMIAVLLPVCKQHVRARIALTRSRDGSVETALPLHVDAGDQRVLRRAAGLSQSERVSLVECIDPVWERKAYNPTHGLFSAILNTLQTVPHT